MTAGGVIAVTAAAVFVAGVFYGMWCDVRRWWDESRFRADQERLAGEWRERDDLETLWTLPTREPWDRWLP